MPSSSTCASETGGAPPLAPPTLGEDGVLLTGQAANLIYLNGGGISTAIDRGYRCGKAIAQALRENKSTLPLYAENISDIASHMQKCISQLRIFFSQVT
ncbi:MAG: hypothetical protein WAO76_01455 [Georgfuchsia sp.]